MNRIFPPFRSRKALLDGVILCCALSISAGGYLAREVTWLIAGA